MADTFFNILVRTSGRPRYFRRCLYSIRFQTFVHYRVIVSVDDTQTLTYVNKQLAEMGPWAERVEVVRVEKTVRTEERTAPWNLYLNRMMDRVTGGWVLILDDDDTLAVPTALQTIACKIHYPHQLIIWQMRWPTGRKIPEKDYFHRMPERKHIGMPCFAFHCTYIPKLRFDAKRAGDYRVVRQLYQETLTQTWIPKVLIQTGNTGLVGARKDLQHEKT